MTGMNCLKGCFLLILCALQSSCALTPKTHFYTLHGIESTAADGDVAYAINPEHTYGIGPLFLPEALMQPGVVSHRQGQSVNLSLYNIWAGNLREAVTRVVASNLSQLTGVDAIWPFPWDNRNRPTRQVRIVFEQFSGELAGTVTLRAKWALTENNGEKTVHQQRVVFVEQAAGEGYGPYVVTMNNLINQLSKNIAQKLSELD